jgi:hypothetical protein
MEVVVRSELADRARRLSRVGHHLEGEPRMRHRANIFSCAVRERLLGRPHFFDVGNNLGGDAVQRLLHDFTL